MIVKPLLVPTFPSFTDRASMRKQIKDEIFKIVKTHKTIYDLLEYKGQDHLFSLIQKKNLSQFVKHYPEYASLPELKAYGKGNYPLTFARLKKETVDATVPPPFELLEVGPYTLRTAGAYSRIELFRPEEVLPLVNTRSDTLIKSLKYVLWTTEFTGIVTYFNIAPYMPARIFNEVQRAFRLSSDSMDLRTRLKQLTISMKRWPSYWDEEEVLPWLELETILGYIISMELSQPLVDGIMEQLRPKEINVVGTKEQFWTDLCRAMETWKSGAPQYEGSFDDWLTDWDQWTTDGSASEVRVYGEDGKKKRVNKSALPVCITKEQLFEGRVQPCKISIKSEVGKARCVYGVGTYDTLYELYLLKKNGVMYGKGQNFISLSPTEKVQRYADYMQLFVDGKAVGSADIEGNDLIHDSWLDMFYLDQVVDEDDQLYLDYMARKSVNYVEFRQAEAKVVPPEGVFAQTLGKRTYAWGRGGLITGRGATSFLNTVINQTFDWICIQYMSRYSEYPSMSKPATIGSDDSVEEGQNSYAVITRFILSTSLLLAINYTKSFPSRTHGEFFRVKFTSSMRGGYVARIVHSIVSSNPVSKQEVDKIVKLKALVDLLANAERRYALKDRLSWFLVKMTEILSIQSRFVAMPVVAGGCGIGQPNGLKATPGMPRFKESVPEFKTTTTWLTSYIELKPEFKEELWLSYFKTMSSGVRDEAIRKDDIKRYKSRYRWWLRNVKVVTVPYKDKKIPNWMRGPTMDPMPTAQRYAAEQQQARARNQIRTFGPHVRIGDVINRVEFKTAAAKLQYLTEQGLVSVTSLLIERWRTYLILDAVLGSLTRQSSITDSVAADMSGAVTDFAMGPMYTRNLRSSYQAVVEYTQSYYSAVGYVCERLRMGGFIHY